MISSYKKPSMYLGEDHLNDCHIRKDPSCAVQGILWVPFYGKYMYPQGLYSRGLFMKKLFGAGIVGVFSKG
jgi:hypothetical protein